MRSDGQPDPWIDDWMADEPSVLQVMVAELQRFKGRMKVHPIPVLLLALVMSAGAVFVFARKPTMYTARIILRISEGALSQYRGAVLPQNELKSYIYNFALSDSSLMEQIIDKHHLFQEELDLFGADGAIDELRDGLSIDAYHNFFHFDKNNESTPRSLRLGIVYTHKDADFAYKMAVLLSDLVVAVESNKRLQEVQFAASNAHEMLVATERERAEREAEISAIMTDLADAELTGDGVGAAMARVKIASLAKIQLREAQFMVNLRREVEQIELNRRAEENNMGLVFELAGQVRPVAKPPPGPFMLGLVGLVCFCIFVPVCAIGLGTIDSRIHELEDVRRLGMPALGHIPAFSGDGVGSLSQRGALAPRGLFRGSGRRRARHVAEGNRVASS
ncbi:MAG TPA: hypothetical protein VNM90_22210 [Haliangium sp.]|nr:hypothetical protein [Haliangium sp.]